MIWAVVYQVTLMFWQESYVTISTSAAAKDEISGQRIWREDRLAHYPSRGKHRDTFAYSFLQLTDCLTVSGTTGNVLPELHPNM